MSEKSKDSPLSGKSEYTVVDMQARFNIQILLSTILRYSIMYDDPITVTLKLLGNKDCHDFKLKAIFRITNALGLG